MKIVILETVCIPLLKHRIYAPVYDFKYFWEGDEEITLNKKIEVEYKGITYKGKITKLLSWEHMVKRRAQMEVSVINNTKFKFIFSYGRCGSYAWCERKDGKK